MASTAVNAPSRSRKPQGTLYRGNEGMWSWVLHRITGVVLFFFLLVHVLDTGLVRISPEAYDVVIETYKNPVVGLAEVGLVGAFLFHALNGLRVILVDFWRSGPRFHKQMLYGVIGLWVILMVPFTVRHLGFVFGE
ncbi:succinate dehydrogenase, cytochrome b556 subunit [Jannaschia sp. R86511]|uniref:succinate dehydrogenase, cytochrome b556 subunit n=1 Tax=Jannaschia sp. R86511 TaxID=3093853 RepID=UPI0036D2AE6C